MNEYIEGFLVRVKQGFLDVANDILFQMVNRQLAYELMNGMEQKFLIMRDNFYDGFEWKNEVVDLNDGYGVKMNLSVGDWSDVLMIHINRYSGSVNLEYWEE